MAGRLYAVVLVLGIALTAVLAQPVHSCPFCSGQGQTLTAEVNQASMVLFGTLANAKLDPNGGFQGSTELNIETVIKKHDFLGDKKMIVLPRYVPAQNNQSKFLVFCDVFNGKIDPYRGIPIKNQSDMVEYLKGALAAKDKPISERLKFFFKYLDNTDLEVTNDAYKEFANADYKDYRDMAKSLPGEKVAKWLQDPETPAFRFGLYASMLGHCGTAKDAEFLRKMLDDPQKRLSSGVDGILAGYTMLKPEEGWDYVRGILKDPKKDFVTRYAALRAARFFWEYRSDLIDKKKVVDGISLLLDQGDIADLAIEDLRKWQRPEKMDQILALYGKESHDIPIVRRSIIRYALGFPEDAKATAFVADMRKKDADMVKDLEELLKLESVPTKPIVTKKEDKKNGGGGPGN